MTDTLPAGVTFVSATGGGTVSGNVVTWPAIASLASGASQGFGVTVTAPATGTLLNIAASTSSTADPVPTNNNGSLPAARVTTTVVEQADVVTTKTGPATVNAGQNFNYAVNVANAGPSAAAAVVVTDTLPAGVTFVSATAGGTLSGNVVTWPAIASLAGGASQGYSVTVTAPATGTLLNIAASRSTTADPDPSNNDGSLPASRVTTTVVAQADVATTKTGPATVNAGPELQLHPGGGQQRAERRGDGGGDRYAAGRGDVRQRHRWRHAERQCGDLAGDREPREWRQPGLRRDGDGARHGHACSTSRRARRARRIRCRPTTTARSLARASPRRWWSRLMW